MITWENSIFINRPQQEVWDFVSNPANDTQWRSSLESAEWTSEGPPGVGSTLREGGKILGRKVEGTTEITAWDPPNEYGRKSASGPFPFEGTMKLEPKEDGTQLTVRGTAEVGGFFKIAEGLLAKQMKKELDTDLPALKLLLEAGEV